MAASPHVFDVTSEGFGELVLANSMKGPVLVNYWAAKAAPCFILMPRLVRLATEYGGRFLLAMLNTDQHGRLARNYGVTSVSTVKIFLGGRVVATIHGAESDVVLRSVIDRYVARPSDEQVAAAVEAYERGSPEEAFRMLREAAAADPGNVRIAPTHAKLLVLCERPAEALTLLESLPQANRELPEVATLLTHARFLAAAAEAPPPEDLERRLAQNPDDLDARFQLAAIKLIADDYLGTFDQLLEIIRRDRAHRDDIGRVSLVALLNTLEDRDLAARYRERLTEALRRGALDP